MRYSLLSQFQGVLVGAAIGELVGISWATQVAEVSPFDSASQRLAVNPDRWFQACASEHFAAQLSTTKSWGHTAVLGAQSLVQRGELNLADWQQLQLASQSRTHSDQLGAIEIAIATLPIALFFHEDETKLYQKLQQICQLASLGPSSVLASFIVSWAIAQALRHQFQAQQLMPRLIAAITRLDTGSAHPIASPDLMAGLVQQLAQVQTLLEQQASLEVARSQLSQSLQLTAVSSELQWMQPIMAALYCGLATPSDWRLAVLRAVQMKTAPSLVATLVGAISGAANSLLGIPIAWRLVLDQSCSSTSRLKLLWQAVESESELLELASHLLATWSGTYDTRRFPVKRHQIPAIAAPRVIRPR